MKVALSILNGRIAPVFDSSRHALVIDTGNGGTEGRHETLSPEAPAATARHLAAVGVRVLVCGAISTELAALLTAEGIGVVPFVAGEVGDVIAAWARGGLPDERLLMPGCSLAGAESLLRRFGGGQPVRRRSGAGTVSIRRVR